MAEWKDSPLASRPEGLDPARYYEVTPERRKLQEQRAAYRAQMKREYLMQLNDPRRKGIVQDPAVDRWMFARNHNIYPNFKPTAKVSLLGLLWTAGPLLFLHFVVGRDRERKLKEKAEGKDDRPYYLGF